MYFFCSFTVTVLYKRPTHNFIVEKGKICCVNHDRIHIALTGHRSRPIAYKTVKYNSVDMDGLVCAFHA